MYAAKHGRLAITQRLLRAGARTDLVDNGGMTALWWAEDWGHTAIAQLLVRVITARRRWARLRRVAPLAGRIGCALRAWYADYLRRSYAPGGVGFKRAREEFEGFQGQE